MRLLALSRHIFILAMMALWASTAQAAMYDLEQVREKLTGQLKLGNGQVQDFDERVRIVENFVKELKELDDRGLGEHGLLAGVSDPKQLAQLKAELAQFRDEVSDLVSRYRREIKPVLVRNVALKRDDKAAKHNKGELALLFFPTKRNHRTGKIISGICSHQQDISSSFFDSQMADAGLLANFPEIRDEPWLREAINMEAELLVLLRMHREYLDGVKYDVVSKTTVAKQNEKVARQSAHLKLKSPLLMATAMDVEKVERDLSAYSIANPDQYSEDERVRLVHQFVAALKSLDKAQLPELKPALEEITRTYQQKVKSILVANVRYQRDDYAAKNNKGDVLSLFFKKRENHFTGKPVTGKLLYQQDRSDSMFGDAKMVDAGLLAVHPELKQEKFIQDALLMEAELVILALQHKKYLDQPASIF